MLKYLLLFITLCVGSQACMMDKNFGCDYQQPGTAHLTFSSSSEPHHIRIGYPDGTTREKPVAAGKLIDMLELKSGSYQLTLHSLNAFRDTLEMQEHSITVTVCNETRVKADL